MIKVQVINLEGLQMLAKVVEPKVLRAVAQNLADAGRAAWVQFALKELHSSRNDYINSIQKVVDEKGTFTITLTGQPANMIEQGADAFDLHDTVLGDNAKSWHTAKDGGRYVAIPFRHKTPTAGPTGGQPMGSQFGQRGANSMAAEHATVKDTLALGKKVHKAAKKLGPSQRMLKGLAPKLREHHTTDIFHGMKVELQPTSSGKSQRTYHTFRTISVGPGGDPRPPGKWLHPGIQARNLSVKVANHIAKIAPATFEAFVQGVLSS